MDFRLARYEGLSYSNLGRRVDYLVSGMTGSAHGWGGGRMACTRSLDLFRANCWEI